jgi:hypothetical protein
MAKSPCFVCLLVSGNFVPSTLEERKFACPHHPSTHEQVCNQKGIIVRLRWGWCIIEENITRENWHHARVNCVKKSLFLSR